MWYEVTEFGPFSHPDVGNVRVPLHDWCPGIQSGRKEFKRRKLEVRQVSKRKFALRGSFLVRKVTRPSPFGSTPADLVAKGWLFRLPGKIFRKDIVKFNDGLIYKGRVYFFHMSQDVFQSLYSSGEYGTSFKRTPFSHAPFGVKRHKDSWIFSNVFGTSEYARFAWPKETVVDLDCLNLLSLPPTFVPGKKNGKQCSQP